MSIKLPGRLLDRWKVLTYGKRRGCEESRLLNHCGQFLPLANRNTHMTRYYTARNWIRLLVAAGHLTEPPCVSMRTALGFQEGRSALDTNHPQGSDRIS